ncbi:unnamed protein product [Strongylus vulgaris]|uniref:Uncharacterized protein n=1 Tax=Strongylus vulgaris TaxID=40348 RepID=A0A3P7KZ56_STRVU|nr:unnamed protein product [Strongylus vulgaris]
MLATDVAARGLGVRAAVYGAEPPSLDDIMWALTGRQRANTDVMSGVLLPVSTAPFQS